MNAGDARTRAARALFTLGRHAEAEAAFLENIRLRKEIWNDDAGSTDRVGLAEVLVAVGREPEALEQYRLATVYRSQNSTLELGIPTYHMDYALLLAKQGRLNEALVVYHEYVSGITSEDADTFRLEPLPIVVAFFRPLSAGRDGPRISIPYDPGVTTWAYAPELFKAATLLDRRASGYKLKTAVWDEIARLAPGWIVPRFYRVYDDSSLDEEEKRPLYDALLAGTLTDGERAIITAVRDGVEVRPAGLPAPGVLRGTSRILLGARAVLADPAFRAGIAATTRK